MLNASYQDHEADSNSAEEEQALKQSFVEASAMLDAVPESFFHIDDTDRIAAFKLSEDFCELGRKELTSGQDLLMSFPPRVNAQLRILFEQCRASKEVQTSEIPLNDILQKKYLYKVRALPLENNHLMLVLKDVTEAGQQRQHIEHTSEQIPLWLLASGANRHLAIPGATKVYRKTSPILLKNPGFHKNAIFTHSRFT